MIKNRFSQNLSTFHGRVLPEKEMMLSGYSALIDSYKLKVPLPEKLSVISKFHRRYENEQWSIYTPRHIPNASLSGHLTFALRYEGIDLAILNALFNIIDSKEIEKWVQQEPIGKYSRRIWFLYEWLTTKKLKLTDAIAGNYVDILDSDQYYIGLSKPSKRHRVRNNLPGVRDFCPLVRRTQKLDAYIKHDLRSIAFKKAGIIHRDVLARASAVLLLKDSQASFAIEGEHPGRNRAERWGRAIGQAGLTPLTIEELLRLQEIVIGDTRFVKLGFRKEGGFIGIHDRATGAPLPDHISARWQDLQILIKGLIQTENLLKDSNMDAVISAAILAFGLVFIHPFMDGNGRIHRYIIHHVLADHEFAPKGLIFPVSAVILDRIYEYKNILEAYSRPRLEFQEWKPTENGNIKVLNNTIDLYRYYDATRQAEFLYDCVHETIVKVLPKEIQFLQKYDKMKLAINEQFEIPAYKADLLIQFLEQNKGTISKRAQTKEFKFLTDKELKTLEKLYNNIFNS
ncbi:filamentation induced by cAMP protein Fic [Reticulomyxa filosa]|uniref:Filamentation induced by cAMP protein Fic n=1 Tax=Reticulomyxa filosa TaxID=46433 RepID=X6MTZ4_RETFI|nr:filamentation induced by cAMP protein Fic [Reticulomyxa filosa]|eukprot:ETO17309.1 filamentation induced by cAMP protein Fic [Reticulomyxa filosa]